MNNITATTITIVTINFTCFGSSSSMFTRKREVYNYGKNKKIKKYTFLSSSFTNLYILVKLLSSIII